jgi:tetratricopeptide (TPR) repeat protein
MDGLDSSVERGADASRSRVRIAFYSFSILVVVGALVYTIIRSRSSPAPSSSAPHGPALIEQAAALSDPPEVALKQAELLAQQGEADRALALLGSVARNAKDDALQSRAVLLAATVLEVHTARLDEAAGLFRYFLYRYRDQKGSDSARYHLGLIELKRGNLAEAESSLTALLRDTPDSPVAPSASYLAADTAKVLAQRESAPNLRIGTAVAELLPSQSGPMAGLAASVILTLISTLFSHKDTLRKGKPLTRLLVLLIVALSVFNAIVNQQLRSQQTRALVAAALQQSPR